MTMDNKFAAVLKLPLVKFAPTYAVGLIAGFFLPVPVCAALLAAAVLAAALPKLLGRRISVCSLGFAVGILLMSLHMLLYYGPVAEMGGKSLVAECRVTDIQSASGDRAVYIVTLNIDGLPVKARLFGKETAQIGDRFEALIDFLETDRRDTDISYGIALTGNIREFTYVARGLDIYSAVNTVREKMCSLLSYNIGGDEGALAMSLLFGDSSLVSAELKEAVTVSGVGHFTAVSGTHFTIFFAIILELMAGKQKTARAVISLILIPMAVIFFGASASVIRSAIMLAICNCSPLLQRRAETLNSLCFAVVAMTVTSPTVILNAGFQMSVLGVFGTAIVGERFYSEFKLWLPGKLKRIGYILKPVTVSACAVICTSPIVLYSFGGISLAGAFTSALLMPFIAIVMLSVMLAGITEMSMILVPAAVVMRFICTVIKFIGGFRNMWLPMDFDGAVLFSLICAVLISLAAISPKRLFEYGIGGFAALMFASLIICADVRSSRCKIVFAADSGSGAAVIVSKTNAVVYISGTGSDFAEELAECLRRNGVLEIECVIAPDMDCSGAAAIKTISQMLPINTVYSPYYGNFPERFPPKSEIFSTTAEYISLGEITLSAAKTGDETRTEDIVMFSGYMRSAPKNNAELALYVSPSQHELPKNGINISETNYEIELERVSEIIIH